MGPCLSSRGFLAMLSSVGRRLSARAASNSRFFNTTRPKLKPSRIPFAVGIFCVACLGLYETYARPTPKSVLRVEDISKDPVYASKQVTEATLDAFRDIVGKSNVVTSTDDLDTHSDSAWSTRHRHADEEGPIAVVLPGSTEDVSKILQICNKKRIPVVAFSGGTSIEGSFTPVYGGISLDLSRLSDVIALHEVDMDVVVQPGVPWEALNDRLSDKGFMIGPDPGPSAQIGGMVGTCCSGTNAFHYGTMRQNVINLTVVLADGTVIKTRRRPRKTAAGYSLTDLFVGAEGTLGIVTEITLKIHPKPRVRRVGILTFNSVSDATETVQSILKAGLKLEAMELMDDRQMKLINQAQTTDRTWDEAPTLLLRFAGAEESGINSQIAEVTKIGKLHSSRALTFAKSDQDALELWSARKNALFSVTYSAPEGYATWGTDAAVPISQLSKIVAETVDKIEEKGIQGTILGHVGDGNFHATMTYDPKTQFETVKGISDWIARRSIELDGTCTGEHGIGLGKRRYLVEEVGPDGVAVMRKIKEALDPNCIMNPGKVFSVSRLHDVEDD